MTFALTGDKTLERRIEDYTRWHSQNIGAELTKSLKSDCHVGKKKSAESVTLP